jgi:hypothetical protein
MSECWAREDAEAGAASARFRANVHVGLANSSRHHMTALSPRQSRQFSGRLTRLICKAFIFTVQLNSVRFSLCR